MFIIRNLQLGQNVLFYFFHDRDGLLYAHSSRFPVLEGGRKDRVVHEKAPTGARASCLPSKGSSQTKVWASCPTGTDYC
jgi:hypothetical protein